jgi:hypothetical protein
VLERYCDFPLPVELVLVFVGVTELKVVATQLSVRVYEGRQVAALAPLAGVLTPDQRAGVQRRSPSRGLRRHELVDSVQ